MPYGLSLHVTAHLEGNLGSSHLQSILPHLDIIVQESRWTEVVTSREDECEWQRAQHWASVVSQTPRECHRIRSQNQLGWKRTLRSSSPTNNLALPSPSMNHVLKVSQGAIHLLKMSRVHESISSLGSLIQPRSPLLQFEAISTYPITYDGGKRVTLPLCNLPLVIENLF